jgi:hypothetical protein
MSLGSFRLFSKIREIIANERLSADSGVRDTRDKLFGGVNNTADKFITGVNDNGA